jgi:2-dehydropantoate 2-reductase
VRVRAEDQPADVPPVDVAIFAVKAYSNPDALPLLKAIVRGEAVALTLQNGVDSVDEVGRAVGPGRTLGGSTYVATTVTEPGLIEQTGSYRRIVFGEVFGDLSGVSDRVQRISDAFSGADIQSEPVSDARVPIWEKFCFLSPVAGFTGAARLPIGPLRGDPACREQLIAAFGELERVARAEGVALPAGIVDRITEYLASIPPMTRSSLLNDLQGGKAIEVEALLGSIVRRGQRLGVATPVMTTLYCVLKPHEKGSSGHT